MPDMSVIIQDSAFIIIIIIININPTIYYITKAYRMPHSLFTAKRTFTHNIRKCNTGLTPSSRSTDNMPHGSTFFSINDRKFSPISSNFYLILFFDVHCKMFFYYHYLGRHHTMPFFDAFHGGWPIGYCAFLIVTLEF